MKRTKRMLQYSGIALAARPKEREYSMRALYGKQNA